MRFTPHGVMKRITRAVTRLLCVRPGTFAPNPRGLGLLAALVAVSLIPRSTLAATTLVNSASGTSNNVALDISRARVTLTLAGNPVTSVVSEISPTEVLSGSTAKSFQYDIVPTIGLLDTGLRKLEITVPSGYTGVEAQSVHVDDTRLNPNCPIPAAGEYCAQVGTNAITVVLGSAVTTNQSHIRMTFSSVPPTTAGIGEFPCTVGEGASIVIAVAGNADGHGKDGNGITVRVVSTQGRVLSLNKTANKNEALIGDLVTYTIAVRNMTEKNVSDVILQDSGPPGFKYLKGSSRINGTPATDPEGDRPILFKLGTLSGFTDGNGNGTADPGERGFTSVSYQLIVGSGASPGDHDNFVVARDYCENCAISNEAKARVEVVLDPLFDLGTIIGKVFEDRNGDGWQDRGEAGVSNAMVALDDGTYALTDEQGRYHFPAAHPGQRMLKLDLDSLPPGTSTTTDQGRIIWLTPGLMSKSNFGVVFHHDTVTIGHAGAPGISLVTEEERLPVSVIGSTQSPALVINGQQIPLPSAHVSIEMGVLNDSLEIVGERVVKPVHFLLQAGPPEEVRKWSVQILNSRGRTIQRLSGEGAAPLEIPWDGLTDKGDLLTPGDVYQYQLKVVYLNGDRATSTCGLLGVNRQTMLRLNIEEDAFTPGKSGLTRAAKQALRKSTPFLRSIPREKILVEGATGEGENSPVSERISKKREKKTKRFLTTAMRLPSKRLVMHWSAPEKNDALAGPVVSEPGAMVNGSSLPIDDLGRFACLVDNGGQAGIEVLMTRPDGASTQAKISLPEVEITQPKGRLILEYGTEYGGCRSQEPRVSGTAGSADFAAVCEVKGRTEPGNSLEIGGNPIPLMPGGTFSSAVPLRLGENVLGLVVKGPDGVPNLSNLRVDVRDRDANGQPIQAGEASPRLTVDLPLAGVRLKSPALRISGTTDPGCLVTVNGQSFAVDAGGKFAGAIQLPVGASRLVVEVVDPDGRKGRIERDVEVSRDRLFLLAFADGAVGQMSAHGYLKGAGIDGDEKLYTEGRIAYYLKGTIAGKYLITSAFDSSKQSFGSLFSGLDGQAGNRLLTNLDPDKFYPVYGDASTVVYDAQSQGKFYLALDSDAVHVVVGDYPLALTDTELSAYQRTLYGGRAAYRSVARTKYGDPDTTVLVFGAEIRQVHVRNELRGTGGSVYYLSQKNVIEGSDQVSIVIRDKITGLVLSRQTRTRNLDYLIKYDEGRLIFNAPLSSVSEGGSLFDSGALSGNPVSIEVDFEAVLETFQKTATGARVRKQIGDHLAIGGSYIQDESKGGPYELKGADAQLRLGLNSRILAEYAQTSGTNAQTYTSDDGGLTYATDTRTDFREGAAWKGAAEIDLGEWSGRPDRYRLNLYYKELQPGFFSSGNFNEEGTRKAGANASFKLSESDTLVVRHDRDERLGIVVTGAFGEMTLDSALWIHSARKWGVALEYLSRESKDSQGNALQNGSFGTARFRWTPTGKLQATLERQQTITGPAIDQTTLGLEAKVLPSLALILRATDGTSGSSVEGGAALKVGTSSVYLTERLAGDTAGRTTTTVLGAKSPIGPSTKIYSEYQWQDAEAGRKTVSLLGIQREWKPSEGLVVVVSGEAGNVDSDGTKSRRTAISSLLSYSNAGALTASSRNECRWESGDTRKVQFLSIEQVDLKLGTDLTLLGRYRYSTTRNRTSGKTEAQFGEGGIGLAYRPVSSDRFNALGRYTRLSDLHPLSPGVAELNYRVADVFSLDMSTQITHRIEWVSKFAARLQKERVADEPFAKTQTWLAVERVNVGVGKRLAPGSPFSIGAEYRVLEQRQANDLRAGWLAEAMWRPVKNFRFGLGYNFTNFSDNEFSRNNYSVKGWFIRVQGQY